MTSLLDLSFNIIITGYLILYKYESDVYCPVKQLFCLYREKSGIIYKKSIKYHPSAEKELDMIKNEDGYKLWLRYPLVSDKNLLSGYREDISEIIIKGKSPTMRAAEEELKYGLTNLLGKKITTGNTIKKSGSILVGSLSNLEPRLPLDIDKKLKSSGEESYYITRLRQEGKTIFIITANSDIGVLYASFHFLRLLETHESLENITIFENPEIKRRLLNHWDNLDRTIERGYAGFSLWDWHKLPDYLDPRYKDYARANASIGINGAVLNNVNANSLSLTKEYILKTKALADLFRPYGIKVYLSAKFNSPMEIGELKNSDPCNIQVARWWIEKVDEIYNYIPDFGGFCIKADSEGQPGPHNYGRTHADGANMFAQALKPYGGIVLWRAFVYDFSIKEDRAKQAYNELKPLDGRFHPNVFIQVKNGPIDFQPREPFHPLFGAMPSTPLAMEFQITQEYLGLATHLVYLAPLYKECLDADTYSNGKESSVAKVIDGSLHTHPTSCISAVANTGTDRNWCGHHFAQANWYAFGRLAWNHHLSAEAIAEEWIRMTFTNKEDFIGPVKSIMMTSREVAVNYRTPLGLHHIMAWDHHYGPGPWINIGRPDWTSIYYHQADKSGIGFDRTQTGSNAVSQYFEPVKNIFSNRNTCPENLLLWFHHVSWDYTMKSGRTLWEELCYLYYNGAESVSRMLSTWESLNHLIDGERHQQIQIFLKIQEKEARWWRDACVLYFQSISGLPIPDDYEKPQKTLEDIQQIKHYYVPGTADISRSGLT